MNYFEDEENSQMGFVQALLPIVSTVGSNIVSNLMKPKQQAVQPQRVSPQYYQQPQQQPQQAINQNLLPMLGFGALALILLTQRGK